MNQNSISEKSTIEIFPLLLPNFDFTEYEGFVEIQVIYYSLLFRFRKRAILISFFSFLLHSSLKDYQFHLKFIVSKEFSMNRNGKVSLENSILLCDTRLNKLLSKYFKTIQHRLKVSFSIYDFFIELKQILVR